LRSPGLAVARSPLLGAPERYYRVEAGCPRRRIDTEDEANGHRNSERQHESAHCDHKGEAKSVCDTESHKQTNEQANGCANKT